MQSRIACLITAGLIFLSIMGCGYPGDLDENFNFKKADSLNQIRISLGRVPAETVIKLLKNNAPLIKIIENKLEVNMQIKFAQEYSQIIENMEKEKYSAALLGPLAVVRYENSVETPLYTPLVRPIRYGADHYSGIIFTNNKNNIDSLSDLKGKSIAFVDRASASGYLFPRATLIDAGLSLRKDFENINFLGRHNLVVRAVYKGKFAAGATFKDARPGVLPEDVKADEVLPILAETKKIPTSPIMIHDKFKHKYPKLTKKLQNLLTSLHNTKQGRKALNKINVDRYIKAESEDYKEVRKVFQTLQKR